MKFIVKLTATLYSILIGLLFLASFGMWKEAPYQPFLLLLLGGPVIVNGLCYRKWGQVDSIVRSVALVVALFYGLILLAIFVTALVRLEFGVFLGLLVFGPPVVVCYFSYRYWPTQEPT